MRIAYLEKLNPTRNEARFYRMEVLPNLFGEWTLAREWGRIGRDAQTRHEWFETRSQAEGALTALETVKRQRGYFLFPQQLNFFDNIEVA